MRFPSVVEFPWCDITSSKVDPISRISCNPGWPSLCCVVKNHLELLILPPPPLVLGLQAPATVPSLHSGTRTQDLKYAEQVPYA